MATTVTYEDVQQARQKIGDLVFETPLVESHGLAEVLGHPVWLKCEMFQRTGSFKTRGALNWVRSASREELDRGLITVSAGNHAQALAWAAREVGVPVTVVMPEDASPIKVEATRGYGAEVILEGDIADALNKLEELQTSRNLCLVHPFDDPRIVAGQGTVGLEILDRLPNVDLILCPVGGGGLISGIGLAAKTASPNVRVVGIEPEGAATLRHAWNSEGPRRLEKVDTVAASLGALVVGELTYAMTQRYVDDVVTVSDQEIVDGLLATMQAGRAYVEPGGAVGIGALLAKKVSVHEGERVAVVLSGGNLDLPLLRGFLQDA